MIAAINNYSMLAAVVSYGMMLNGFVVAGVAFAVLKHGIRQTRRKTRRIPRPTVEQLVGEPSEKVVAPFYITAAPSDWPKQPAA